MTTTDNQNEIFDIVDEDDNVVGQAKRGEVHKDKNLIHRSIGVAVFNGKGELFLQKRSMTKDTEPEKWTISCSGHVNSADTYANTARRELQEELGVDLVIKPFAKYICRAPHETEMVMLFKAYCEGPFQLHLQEISEGKFITRIQLKTLVTSKEIELSFMGKLALEKLGWL
ncbi:NUDIX domain-containing protein [Candidatus Gottesmanbacteria bacterium]|nr:NUDIX domain-containing protein [Candidatus Gottesmanbacteria bacterium]